MVTRAEHRINTLLQLGNAAVELFETNGPSTTIDAIAKRAGVSRRTVFRYVEAKEELAFVHPILWFDVFDEALDEFGDGPLEDKFRFASAAIAAHIDADPEPSKRAFALLLSMPELSKGFNNIYQRWIERVAAEVIAHVGGADATGRFHARIVGAAVMGMVDATVREWMFAPPGVTFSDLYLDGFAVLVPLFVAVDDQRP